MRKLIKYDLKADYKKLVALIIGIIILDTISFMLSGKISKDGSITLIILINYSACFVTVILGVMLFNKYTGKDAGYLFFTLPNSGSKILITRFLSAFIENTIVSIFGVGIGALYIIQLDSKVIKYFNLFTPKEYLIISVLSILEYIVFFNAIYFCIILSKTVFKNKKIGGVIAFLIIILIIVICSLADHYLSIILPYNINLFVKDRYSYINGNFKTSLKYAKLNIASLIFQIALFIGLFKSSTILIDKKMDL